MKKTSIIVLVIASVMLLASCGGVNDFNTPKDVIGEWKGSTSEAVDTSTVDKNEYAGTYTYETTITNPLSYESVVDYYYTSAQKSIKYFVPVTNKINVTRTIKDDYSFTEKLTIVTSVAQRNSISGSTETFETFGSPAYSAATKTIVRDIEVVVTPNKDGSFLEKTTTTDTISASGAYGIFDNMNYDWNGCDYFNPTLSTTAQTRTTVSTSYVKDVNELAYRAGKTVYYFDIDQNYYSWNDSWSTDETLDSLCLNLSNFTRTDAPRVTTTYTVQTDYNLVVGEDGTFTYTTTETKKYTAPEAKDVVVKNVYTGMATGSGDGYLTLNTKKAVYTVDAEEAVTEEFSNYDTYDYYIVNKTLQINGMPTLTLVEPAK